MKLVVGNLPSAATEAEVRAVFEKFGQGQVHLEEGRASVTFHDTAHAEEARSHLHLSSLSGAQITMEAETPGRARSRSRSPPKAPAAESPRKDSTPRSPAKPPAESAPPVTDSSEQGQSPAKVDASSVPVEPAQTEESKAGEEVCADDGSRFKIENVNPKNEELSQWRCLACNRTMQKKSVKAHTATKTHKQHLTN